MADVSIKSFVAKSAFDYTRQTHGDAAWDQILARLENEDRVAITAGGNVPLTSMGAFNLAYVDVICGGSKFMGAKEFQVMGAKSAEQLLLNNGIFSIFARLVTPKAVLGRAEKVIKTAYPGAECETILDPGEGGGLIRLHGMSGYHYGSQRIVGWLMRGIDIVGGREARVTERNWDAGRVDSPTYEVHISWEGWRS